MNEETMEMMEVTENEAVESDMDNATEDSGSGMVLGLVLAGVAGMVAGGTAVYKKLKAKTGSNLVSLYITIFIFCVPSFNFLGASPQSPSATPKKFSFES